MSKSFEELDYQHTPLGDLMLRRRLVPTLDNLEVFEVKLGDEYLMSSMFHAAEDALADLGLADLAGSELDIVVGGLGLGYTAVAALKHAKVRSLLIVDVLDAVIGWHRRGLVPLGEQLTSEPRCRIMQGDFFALAGSEAGFESGRQFHAVLLDIDHAPDFVLHSSHEPFYSEEGLHALARHLHPGGVFALWSNDAPHEEVVRLLDTVFTNVRAHVVAFPNPLTDGESSNTVYVATKMPGEN